MRIELSGHHFDSADPISLPAPCVAAGTVALPCSKSIAQRALVLAALAGGESVLRGITPSEDVARLLAALAALGIEIAGAPPAPISVRGTAGVLPGGEREVDAGENGTALRALIALASLRPAPTTIRGAQHRPVAPLVAALRALGVEITATGAEEHAPVRVAGGAPPWGGAAAIDGAESSQFATALLLIAPCLDRGLELSLGAAAVSLPYITLTIEVLRRFGAEIEVADLRRINVAPLRALRAADLSIEGDASAAAFYLAAGAATGGTVRAGGVGRESPQGDIRFLAILESMGCKVAAGADYLETRGRARHAVQLSLRDWPDLVPPLAALAACAVGETRITGIGHLRHKESDRIQALARSLGAVGVRASAGADHLAVEGTPAAKLRPALLDAAGDHRMAMAFALLALAIPGVRIAGSSAVVKSDPEFFARLGSLLLPKVGVGPVS
ncbi:MAG: 3-phosphoshikimate 1-carboxyvinyltransferase [Planctomycetes bacterium]|nr:3-phosphoshikimate 1-carboxyvinyltransferase [Planctomycetota bacterium]